MQFHLNGFQPGDPDINTLDRADEGAHLRPQNPDAVDVLIIGCGPAGLILAAFPAIKIRIVEAKTGPLLIGQADGIACRTMEMFHAFGFCEKVMKEAYWVNETTFWKPDEQRRKNITRSGRIEDTEDGLSEFPHVILNQARVHDFLLEVMRNSSTQLVPDYGKRLVDLQIDTDAVRPSDYPVTAILQPVAPDHQGPLCSGL